VLAELAARACEFGLHLIEIGIIAAIAAVAAGSLVLAIAAVVIIGSGILLLVVGVIASKGILEQLRRRLEEGPPFR